MRRFGFGSEWGDAGPALSAPVRVSAPAISGALQVGQTLTIDPLAVYSGNPEPVVSYRWQQRDAGGAISNIGTGTSLILLPEHEGMEIRIGDMATNSQGATGWTNNPWSAEVTA